MPVETPKIHVLLIDDDEVMRQLFGGLLSTRGFEVIYAQDGASGWESARKFKPELILLDYRMEPGMDGMEVAENLKKGDDTKQIPLVMLSNEDFSADAQKYLKEIGVDDAIHKGAEHGDIIRRIAAVLEKHGIPYIEPATEV